MDELLKQPIDDLFSVIVLCYNNSEYLKTCLDSILGQAYDKIQIIVADDKSKSFPAGEFESYINENKGKNIVDFTVYQNKENLGTVKNINEALKKANGEYVKIIACDDALADENTLKNAKDALDKCPDSIVTGNVLKCDANLQNPVKYLDRLQHKLNDLSSMEIFKNLCVHNDIIAGGVFFKKDFFERYGLFDESYRLLEDWPMWLKASKMGCSISYSPFNTIKYRSNGGIGTGMNPLYMADKKTVLKEIIIPSRKFIGNICYIKSRISFFLINSKIVRKTYSLIFRKGN